MTHAKASRQAFQFVSKRVGKPLDHCYTEIVPSELPINVHVIPPGKTKNPHVTLFTSGLSELELERSSKYGGPERMELIIDLPADWPVGPEALADQKTAWPIKSLRELAIPISQYSDKFSQFMITSTSQDPAPIAKGTKMSWFLLVCNDHLILTLDDQTRIGVYQVFPLYESEALYANKKGVMELLRLFDAKKISTIVDLSRRAAI